MSNRPAPVTRQYVFGPVASRRLGCSLGVDLVPPKVCTFDCVYCESGVTTRSTLERREYVPTRAVLSELEVYLRDRPTLDYITFSGAGEPTLHAGIGEVIAFVKSYDPPYRVAVLTNSTLLPDPEVRRVLRPVDLLIPSLDAADDAVMARINRPVDGLSASAMIAGLIAFRRESEAQMWLEVFIVPGINDTPEHLQRLRNAIERIAPDRVQLNSLDRPGPERWVEPADRADLERIAAAWQPLPVEIVARNPRPSAAAGAPADPSDDLAARVMALVSRRPATAADIQTGLAVTPDAAEAALRDLLAAGRLVAEPRERGTFYRPRRPGDP